MNHWSLSSSVVPVLPATGKLAEFQGGAPARSVRAGCDPLHQAVDDCGRLGGDDAAGGGVPLEDGVAVRVKHAGVGVGTGEIAAVGENLVGARHFQRRNAVGQAASAIGKTSISDLMPLSVTLRSTREYMSSFSVRKSKEVLGPICWISL